jgi:hypothetical protein
VALALQWIGGERTNPMKMIMTVSALDLARVFGGADKPWWGDGPRPPIDVDALTKGPELGSPKEPGVKYFERDHSGKTGAQQAVENVDRILGGYDKLNDAGKAATRLGRMVRGR